MRSLRNAGFSIDYKHKSPLPILDGLEATRRIKATEAGKATPILALFDAGTAGRKRTAQTG
jgi:CheY-like chemotaxis protein